MSPLIMLMLITYTYMIFVFLKIGNQYVAFLVVTKYNYNLPGICYTDDQTRIANL